MWLPYYPFLWLCIHSTQAQTGQWWRFAGTLDSIYVSACGCSILPPVISSYTGPGHYFFNPQAHSALLLIQEWRGKERGMGRIVADASTYEQAFIWRHQLSPHLIYRIVRSRLCFLLSPRFATAEPGTGWKDRLQSGALLSLDQPSTVQ